MQKVNLEKERLANEVKQVALRARMENIHKKFGKTAMPRSMKKKLKREKEEIKIDQATLDQKRYLGEIDV